MHGNFFPILIEFFSQSEQLCILTLAPAFFCFVTESSEATVTHFSISTRDEFCDFIKFRTGFLTNLHQQLILIFCPCLLDWLVSLGQQIVPSQNYFWLILIFRELFHLGISRCWSSHSHWNHLIEHTWTSHQHKIVGSKHHPLAEVHLAQKCIIESRRKSPFFSQGLSILYIESFAMLMHFSCLTARSFTKNHYLNVATIRRSNQLSQKIIAGKYRLLSQMQSQKSQKKSSKGLQIVCFKQIKQVRTRQMREFSKASNLRNKIIRREHPLFQSSELSGYLRPIFIQLGLLNYLKLNLVTSVAVIQNLKKTLRKQSQNDSQLRWQESNQLQYFIEIRMILHLKAALFALLLTLVVSQGCLNALGQPVAWWVVIKVPPKIGKIGYGYHDSTSQGTAFTYIDAKIDVGNTALTKTFSLINSLGLETVAWNDEKPSGQTSTSSAHSKGFIAYSNSVGRGYLLSHSVPKYPAFTNNVVNMTIATGQNYNGQHLTCFTMTIKELDEVAARFLITQPYVYQGYVVSAANNQNLLKLAKSEYAANSTLFAKYDLQSAIGYSLKSIFKNDKINGSIFEDGLTGYLGLTPLIAQTWGQPVDKSWCSKGFEVFNTVQMSMSGVNWTQNDDHSKWVIVKDAYACFGDMNRVSTQWKRGGAFFCLNSPSLIASMKGLVKTHDSC